MRPLEQALTIYEDWLATGRLVTAAQLVAQHPELADHLQAMLADGSEVEKPNALADQDGRVLGDFRIKVEIGRGGMGVVYRAWQRSLDREVALKVLPGHVTLHASAVARFRREATLAARLEHPNIVAIHAVGSDGDAHYFAMELIDGGPLSRDDPRTGAPRPVRECVELCATICAALEHAHGQGVLHRDVKPGNILVRSDGRPVLTDFGLARELDEPGITRTGAFTGTAHYASPEQAAGRKDIDARADVFSLGATLYELLTGRRPFQGDSMAEVLDQIARTEPPDPLRLAPDLAPDLAAIVLKSLEKSRDRRYRSAAAFAADLRAFLDYRPVSARRASVLTRARRWARREPWRAFAALALLLGIPATSAAVGYLVANREAIQVGAREIRRSERDERLAQLTLDLEAGNYEAALAGADLAVLERPDDIEAHALRAMVKLSVGSGDAALAELDSAIAARNLPDGDRARIYLLTAMGRDAEARTLEATLGAPASPEALFLAGSATTLRGQRELVDPAAWGGVRDTCLRAILVSPSPRLHYYLKWANAIGWTQDAAAITQCHATLLELWPDSPAALLYVAFALRRLDPARAAATYRRVLTAGYDHPRIHTSIADCLENLGDKAGAMAAARDGVAGYRQRERDGLLGDAEALNLVIALHRTGEIDEAIARARASVAAAPKSARGFSVLGWLLGETRDFEGATTALTAAIDRNPKDSYSLMQLAEVRMAAGDPVAAAAALRRCAEILPGTANVHYLLGKALLAAADFAGAATASRRAVELAPKQPEFHFHSALTHYAAGDMPGAEAACAAVLALRPGHGRALRLLGDIQDARGESAQAIASWRAGVTGSPEDAALWQRLGAGLLRAGDRQAALPALQAAVTHATAGPESIEFLRGIATTAGGAGDHGLARAALTRALQCSPSGPQRADLERELASTPRQ